ncbi:MAG: hydroxyisourate hydrolase [Bacteroidia bacterium]|nr:hydroxyisourate hydrolase [Bacteroidia bacterium]
MSKITTHILDTSVGKPAAGVLITLEQAGNNNIWTKIGEGHTNADGRLVDFIKPEIVISPGRYKLHFETAAYFEKQKVKSFYPFVEIVFEIRDDSHYHVPLLLNPFGYSTYRGS